MRGCKKPYKACIKHAVLAALTVVVLLLPGYAFAGTGSGVKTMESPSAESLEIRVRYNDFAGNEYKSLKTLSLDYFKQKGSEETYTLIDSLPVPCVSPARGVFLTELLADCGIDYKNVKQIRVWCTDGDGKSPNKSYTYDYLFMPRFFYPNMEQSNNWETGATNTRVKFHDMKLAAQGQVRVEPMIAFEDRWQRYKSDTGNQNNIDLSYSGLDGSVRFRLLFGLEDLTKYHDGDEIEANAFDSMKWIYRMDIALDQQSPNSGGGGQTVENSAVSGAGISKQKSSGYYLTDTKGHWAEASIGKLVELGVVNGNPDGSFHPDEQVTRAQFAAMLIKTMVKGGMTALDSSQSLSDAEGHWAKVYLSTAVDNKIIIPQADGSVSPDRLITREEMAGMLARALNLKGNGGSLAIGDRSQVSTWAVDSVSALLKSGGITGFEDGTFKPKNQATRAQAAVTILRSFTNAGYKF